MRKIVINILIAICMLGVFGCSNGKEEPDVVNTFKETPIGLIEEYFENSKIVITTTYYEMSDGTWRTSRHTYKYKLEITGRMNNAVKDSTYVILSNSDNITFEQAWKASGWSSNLDDYFKDEEAIIVGIL